LLEVLRAAPASYVVAATYELDPPFFEEHLLRTNALLAAQRILVFVDGGRYAELAQSERSARELNRRYLVVPVTQSGGVFHPKLFLLAGPQRITLLAGSANATRSGMAYNLELCHVLELGQPDDVGDRNPPGKDAVQESYRFFRRIARMTRPSLVPLALQVLEDMRSRWQWLAENTDEPNGDEPELLHTLDEGLWAQVIGRLKGHSVKRVVVVSPFYDSDISLWKRVLNEWPGCRLEVISQQGYGNIPVAQLSRWRQARRANCRLFELNAGTGRRAHAKAMAFQTQMKTFWLAGSANFTTAALDGFNVEAALWFATDDPPDILFSGTIRRMPIAPDDFSPGQELPPESRPTPQAPRIILESAILDETETLRLAWTIPQKLAIYVLRASLRQSVEVDPWRWISIQAPRAPGFSMAIDESDRAELQGAVVVELEAETPVGLVRSNPVWLVQEIALTRDPNSSVHIAAERLRLIEETGEGLDEHFDALWQQQQWEDLLHFLLVAGIRFDDGALPLAGRLARIGRPRPAFRPDLPPTWTLPPVATVEALRNAVWDFVTRHQNRKLLRHVQRGNINGILNFFDIFSALNRLLLACFRRGLLNNHFVIAGLLKDIALFTGKHVGLPPDEEEEGFLDTILEMQVGQNERVRQRLIEEGVPAKLVAALRAAERVRTANLPSYQNQIAHALSRVRITWPLSKEVTEAEKEYRTWLSPTSGNERLIPATRESSSKSV
jgi:hypothetical protein